MTTISTWTDIDLDDFVLFCSDWLWVACWRHDLQDLQMMRTSAPMAAASVDSTRSVAAFDIRPPPDIKEQYQHALKVVLLLEHVWLSDDELRRSISDEKWQIFMDAVYQWLGEVEILYNESKDDLYLRR